MKSAILFADGELSNWVKQQVSGQSFDVVVAADGGARPALQCGFPPHYVVGDLDSLTADLRARLTVGEGTVAQIIRRPSQYRNDLEKALQFCRELEITDITLVGISGGRLDHTLTNLSVLGRYDQMFRLTIYDTRGWIYLVREQWRYEGPAGQVISLIPMGRAQGIVTHGLRYPLRGETLELGKREGLSNRISASPVEIRVEKGLLCIYLLASEAETETN